MDIVLSGAAVFLQGIFSFFSPCVLPLVPLYMGYLSGGAKELDADGNVIYPRKKIMISTLFFVLGVSFAFFVLGMGVSAAGMFFKGNRMVFARIGGVIIILFGFFQLGVFGKGGMLGRDFRLPLRLDRLSMNPLTALLFGFTFSFAWSPCIGPMLASVLTMASFSDNTFTAFALIGLYALGFVLPFLAVGLFTGKLLALFKKHRNVVNYTVKAGGVLMILMGVMMYTGWMNSLTGYLSSFGGLGTPPASSSSSQAATPAAGSDSSSTAPDSSQPASDKSAAFDFAMVDQYGNEHTLADYKGKVIFLNFWTTWCGYCVKEMPEIEELYQEYGLNAEDVVMLGVANPRSKEYPNNADVPEAEIVQFLADSAFTYPTLMDRTGEMFAAYGVNSFPTTFMIDTDGNVFGYVSGQISKSIMQDIIKQTQSSTAK